jgi:hypothetical protein
MREIVLLRGEVTAVSTLVKNPPPPSFIGEAAPAALFDVLTSELPADTGAPGQLLAFVTPSCGPCEGLVSGLRAAIDTGRVHRDDVLFVIWALPLSDWKRFSKTLPARAVPDIEGRLARICEVRGTPAMFVLSRADSTVLDYNPTGDAEWAITRITNRTRPLQKAKAE